MVQVFKINSINPQTRLISKAADILASGGIIVYPTDTVYGLGCDIFNKKAIQKIYQIKGKSFKQPLSFIVPNLKQISQYALVSNKAYRIMRKLLPGPYTFVLQASRLAPKRISSVNKKTVGIRIPNNQVCISILKEFSNPIISTSANISGEDVLSDPYDIKETIGHSVDLIIDCGVSGNMASTVIDLTQEEPVILRMGSGEFNLF